MGVLRILWKKSCLGMFFGILYVSYEFVWAYNVLSLGIETGLLGGCCIKDLSINSSLIKQMYPSAAHLILHLLSSICLWTCGVVSSYISLFRPMFNINLIFNLLIYIYTIFSISHIYSWYPNFIRNSWMFPKAQCFSASVLPVHSANCKCQNSSSFLDPTATDEIFRLEAATRQEQRFFMIFWMTVNPFYHLHAW